MNSLKAKATLLIGLEGADWERLNPLIEQGLMPTLCSLMDRGVTGTMSCPEPLKPPLIWNSAVTGRHASDHRILGDLVYENGQPRQAMAHHRKVPAIWDILDAQGLNTQICGHLTTLQSQLKHGIAVSEFFGSPGLESSPEQLSEIISQAEAAQTLAECWLRAEQIPADKLAFFIPKVEDINQNLNPVLTRLTHCLAHSLSLHSAFLWQLKSQSWQFASLRLPLLEDLMQMFLPMSSLKGEEGEAAEMYLKLVPSAYRFVDVLLAAVLQAAGDEASVFIISGAGFTSANTIRNYQQWLSAPKHTRHSPRGIFIASAANIRQKQQLYGASLFDLVPTLLHHMGLQVATDMPGRVLQEIFDHRQPPQYIDSWDTAAQSTARPEPALSQHDDAAIFDLYQQLGMKVAPSQRAEQQIGYQIKQDDDWTLALAELKADRPLRALPILERLVDDEPERLEFIVELADCQTQLGLYNEARLLLEGIQEIYPEHPRPWLYLAQLELAIGDFDSALLYLKSAEEFGGEVVAIRLKIAQTRLHLRQWSAALAVFDELIKEDKRNSEAHLGRGRALLAQGQYQYAAKAAIAAIDQDYHNPFAHYVLGMSLLRRRYVSKAEHCFKVAIAQDPLYRHAHLQMYRIKRRRKVAKEQFRPHIQALRAAKKIEERKEQQREFAAKRQMEREDARRQQALDTGSQDATRRKGAEEILTLMLVCGLPRSGCSAVLKALEAGGLVLMKDEREAEIFAQWSKLEDVREKPELLKEAVGKVIRINPLQMIDMPRRHNYKLIYVKRHLLEVASSQQQLLEEQGETKRIGLKESLRLLSRQERIMEQLFRISPNIDCLTINYGELCAQPERHISQIRAFLGETLLPKKDAMVAVILPELHRVKRSKLGDLSKDDLSKDDLSKSTLENL